MITELAAAVNASGLCQAGNCAFGEISGAELGRTITMLASEFDKTIVVVAIIGAVIGICAWELFKYMYRYGKQHARKTK